MTGIAIVGAGRIAYVHARSVREAGARLVAVYDVVTEAAEHLAAHFGGIVEPEIALSAILGRDAEIETDGFGMSDVKIAVRLGRKTGVYPPAIAAGPQILVDNGANEIDWPRRFYGAHILSIFP